MSKTVPCPRCGNPMDVPAYPGDGVYKIHTCPNGYDATFVVGKCARGAPIGFDDVPPAEVLV